MKNNKKVESIFWSEMNRPDPNSIKTTTMLSFTIFAAILIIALWALTTFFINTYYSSLRTRETMNIATNLETQYHQNPINFESYAFDTAATNSVYIKITRIGLDEQEYDGTSGAMDSFFKGDVKNITKKLNQSRHKYVTDVIKDNTPNYNSRLLYASNIGSMPGLDTLCIIAPLYPDQATINVIRSMLLYISLIVLLIAVILAFYLSNRLARPIQNITKSAKELSRGNFNVKFDGSNFTETKELAKTLNKASYEMEKTDFYQREILSNISHDLKTPLTMIRGYAEKIVDITGENKEKRNKDLNVIISETERLNSLVTDMMTVSNLQSNNLTLNKETFDIIDAAKSVYESFLVLNSSENFDIQFKPCRATYVNGDKNKIQQVISNFISNAVKYSEDNKTIILQIKRVGKKVAVHCIDHGLGIPSDELPHVWDRYYRTSVNHGREIDGSGLGLSIVKGILALHNASYGVNSEEGKGSDFWFEIETVKKPAGTKNNEQKK